jgi:LytS/YehU family sensor histidine kinase
MARKPMVTRTIVTTKVNVLCLDIKSSEPFNKVVTLPRTYKDEKMLLKKVEEVVNTDDVKAVHIVDKEEVETLYGMTEQDFITNAKILDPATRKEFEAETEKTEN